MERRKHNDCRAGHTVNVFEYGTNVKFQHKGFEVSLASDGQETIVFDHGDSVFEVSGTNAEQVAKCVSVIDAMLAERAK